MRSKLCLLLLPFCLFDKIAQVALEVVSSASPSEDDTPSFCCIWIAATVFNHLTVVCRLFSQSVNLNLNPLLLVCRVIQLTSEQFVWVCVLAESTHLPKYVPIGKLSTLNCPFLLFILSIFFCCLYCRCFCTFASQVVFTTVVYELPVDYQHSPLPQSSSASMLMYRQQRWCMFLLKIHTSDATKQTGRHWATATSR